MKELTNTALIQKYLRETGFQEYFSFPIQSYLKLYRVESEEYIFSNYGINTNLVYLVNGLTKLTRSLRGGERSIIDFPTAPFLFGEMELFTKNYRTIECRAITRCDYFVMPFLPIKSQLLSDCKFLNFVCSRLAAKERQKTDLMIFNSIYPLQERFAFHLLNWATEDGLYRISPTDTAIHLGCTERHLLRVISHFIQNGYMKKAPRGYQILNSEALEQLSSNVDVGDWE